MSSAAGTALAAGTAESERRPRGWLALAGVTVVRAPPVILI